MARVRARRAETESAPSRIGRFVVLRELGRGGMGVVYAGFDDELDRRVAIKVLHRGGSEATERMRREAQAMAKLNHPNVASVYEVGEVEGQVYLAMEFVRGRPLSRWLLDDVRDVDETLDVLMQAGEGLSAAHAAGLVHRDFKPDNVMVGDDGRVRVLDFGLAGLVDRSRGREPATTPSAAEPRGHLSTPLTQTGSRMGTPAYMSPEQFAGDKVGPASDQFSFCVTLHEALYGERPFTGRTTEEIERAVTQGRLSAAPPYSAVSPRLRAIVLQGLSTRPDERHADMHDLLLALGSERDRGARLLRRLLAVGALFVAAALILFAVRERHIAQDRARYAAERDEVAVRSEARAQQSEAIAKDEAQARRLAEEARHNALLVAVARGEQTPAAKLAYLREVVGDRPEANRRWQEARGDANAGGLRALARYASTAGEMMTVAASPDGELLAFPGPSDDLCLWRWRTEAEPFICHPHDSVITSVRFSTDGRRVASGSWDHTVRIWPVGGDGEPVVLNHGSRVWSLDFSPDGTRLATATDDAQWHLWALDPEPSVRDVDGHDDGVMTVRFSPDGRRVASGSEDRSIRVWDLDRLDQPELVLRGHDGEVLSVDFDTTSTRLVSASYDGTVRIWDADSGKPICTLRGHGGRVLNAAFTPDGDQVASASLDGTVRLWSVTLAEQLAVLESSGRSKVGLAIDPRGRFVASTGTGAVVDVWALEPSFTPGRLGARGELGAVGATPDGKLVVAGGDHRAAVWRFDGGWQLAAELFDTWGDVWDVAPHPRQPQVAIGSSGGLRLWNYSTGKLERLPWPVVEGEHPGVLDLDWDSTGRRLVAGGRDGSVRIFDLAGGRAPVSTHQHERFIMSVDFSPDDQWIAVGSHDGTVSIMDAEGNESQRLAVTDQAVDAVAISPDGRRLLTGSSDGNARMWIRDEGGAFVVRRTMEHGRPVTAVAFHPDGLRWLTASGPVWQLWTEGEPEPVPIVTERADLRRVAWTLGGEGLVTGDYAENVQTWELDRALFPRSNPWSWPYCVGITERMERLYESRSQATANHRRCVELVEFCSSVSAAVCDARVRETFAGLPTRD